ncbi:HAMP domain-containing histidine kinase [Flavobacterium sp. AS60]|uniref:sensor histidine kinase n=1 Tax=Flavobacterium anseongense TaxID=2910677 RepID=UPI001F3092FF|nr:HAMP domain-containing sensor histidine kinase [Flavobacterium sp. AS60]MCF6130502.1 HAMP domain-containing histidine kinase [Flavobacterium sp. AS60]
MNNTNTYSTTLKEQKLDLIEKVAKYRDFNDRLLNLFYTISHNLNAHTANFKSLLDVIDFENDPVENKMLLSHLRSVSDGLNQTISDLFKLVTVENNADVTKEWLNLHQKLEKVRTILIGYKNENQLTFINNVPDDVVVNFNRAYLESVLLNFTTNAIKYAHKDRLPVVEFNFFTENGKKVLTITDNGLGIDLDRHRDSLFGLYKTFHKHEDAKGFGLYISKYQIEAMNGSVTVESKVGEGSTFKIHFSN